MSRLESEKINCRFPLREEAAADIRNIKEENPNNFVRAPQLPREFFKEIIADFDKETQLLEIKNINTSSKDKDSIFYAKLLIRNEEYPLAQKLLRKVLQENSYDVEAIKLLGQCHQALGQYSEALQFFEIALEQIKNFDNTYNIANLLYEMGQDQLSSEYYLSAIALAKYDGPKLFEVYKNLGNIFVRAGDFNLAEEYYNKAYTIHPESDVLLVNYGTLEMQKGCFDVAVERFRNAVEINNANDKAWVGLALIHRSFGDIDLSWANIEKALDNNQANSIAMHLMVEWGLKDSRFDALIGRLEKYLSKNDQDAAMSLNLAKVLTCCGRIYTAEIEIERALALEPTIPGGAELYEVIKNEIKRQRENFVD